METNMEQKYVYIPNEEFWIIGRFLDLLKNDCYYKKPDKNCRGKRRCLKMCKNVFKDKILKEEDYDYLLRKYWDFHKNCFVFIHIAQTEREILHNIWNIDC